MFKYMNWCIKEGIKVYPKPEGNKLRLYSELPKHFSGKDNTLPIKGNKLYSKKEWSNEILKVYEYYYNKIHKKYD